jgi:hypothetical protein
VLCRLEEWLLQRLLLHELLVVKERHHHQHEVQDLLAVGLVASSLQSQINQY